MNSRGPLTAVSPHLDDVVLGCAGLVAAHPGALVVTVTAGKPPPHPLTDWDRKCGFAGGDDVIEVRRKEDEAALTILGARTAWLDFLDRQYMGGIPPYRAHVAGKVLNVVEQSGCDSVALPLGLLHPDHIAISTACLDVAMAMPKLMWIVYEDAIYRANDGLTDQAVARLSDEGFMLEALHVPATDRKPAAIACYTSQLKGLGDLVQDAYEPERYWTLITPK